VYETRVSRPPVERTETQSVVSAGPNTTWVSRQLEAEIIFSHAELQKVKDVLKLL